MPTRPGALKKSLRRGARTGNNLSNATRRLRILRFEMFAPAIGADSTLNQLAPVWSLEVLALLTMLASVWLVLVFGFRFADLLLLGLGINGKSSACHRGNKTDRSHQISA
jgi:hypothetical protein